MKRATKTKTPRNVDEYLSRVPPEQRQALEELRRTIKSLVPDAVEVISYQIPTFKLNGRMLVSYAAFNQHCSFFPGAGPIGVHKNDLKSFATSKGTIRFTPEEPLSATLVKKLIRTRIKLNESTKNRRKSNGKKP